MNMVALLQEELDLFSRHARAEAWPLPPQAPSPAEIEEAVAFGLHLYHRIVQFAERAQPGPFDEPESRKLTPLFRQWYDYAGQILQLARAAKSKGQEVLGMPDFIRAYNRSKIMVEDFDGLVESMKRIAEGRSAGRPLRERDELSDHDGAAGG